MMKFKGSFKKQPILQGHCGRLILYRPTTGLRKNDHFHIWILIQVVFPGPLLNVIQILAGIAFLDPVGVLADMLYLSGRNNCSIEFWESSLFLLPDAGGCVTCPYPSKLALHKRIVNRWWLWCSLAFPCLPPLSPGYLLAWNAWFQREICVWNRRCGMWNKNWSKVSYICNWRL